MTTENVSSTLNGRLAELKRRWWDKIHASERANSRGDKEEDVRLRTEANILAREWKVAKESRN